MQGCSLPPSLTFSWLSVTRPAAVARSRVRGAIVARQRRLRWRGGRREGSTRINDGAGEGHIDETLEVERWRLASPPMAQILVNSTMEAASLAVIYWVSILDTELGDVHYSVSETLFFNNKIFWQPFF